MRADVVHAAIANRFRKHATILTFPDLVTEISLSSKAVHSVPLSPTIFRDWISLKAKSASLPKIRDIKEFQVRQGNSMFYYKRRLDAPDYLSCMFLGSKAVPSIPQSRDAARGLKTEKKDGIVKGLLPLMPVQKREY